MDYDPAQLSTSNAYALMIRAITPRPIAWVSTLSPSGVPNLAQFSYFAGVGSNPPTLMVSIANRPSGEKKDTLRNIEATGEFVVNIVPLKLAQPMVRSADDDRMRKMTSGAHAGLETSPSQLVRPSASRRGADSSRVPLAWKSSELAAAVRGQRGLLRTNRLVPHRR
jgi:flavin reductase (DIM6/NTAB) family NADH-FMN oxidoreductase RutF